MNDKTFSGARKTSLQSLRRYVAFDEFGVAVALAALVILIGVFHPDFLTPYVLLDVVRAAAFVAIVAYGMVFLLAMSEIDLSVGGIYAISIMGAALLMSNGLNSWFAAVAGILIGMGLGFVNGLLANLFRLPALIITIGTLSAYRGLAVVISGGRPVQDLPLDQSFFSTLGDNFLGIPVAVWFVVLFGVGLTVLFLKTRFGAMVRAIGSNQQAARFSGIPIERVRILALVLVGGLAGLSGMLSLAFFQGADPTLGVGLELQVIAAAIIGGTAISGGSGTVPGALLGALIVAVINSGLIFFSVPSIWTNFVTGAVIILAVGLDGLLRRRRAERALKEV